MSIRENKTVYIRPEDASKAEQQLSAGHTEIQETPDSTVVFLTPAEWKQMKQDRAECVGCLSQCQFSTWSRANGTTGKLPDPRSYCIHKTLYEVGHNGSIKDNLLFAGHQVYRFATDPLYRNGIPTVKELIEKSKTANNKKRVLIFRTLFFYVRPRQLTVSLPLVILNIIPFQTTVLELAPMVIWVSGSG